MIILSILAALGVGAPGEPPAPQAPIPQAAVPAGLPPAGVDAAGSGAKITQPRWIRLPSGDDFARAYPYDAQVRGIEGRAVMVCSVTADGRLEACKIVEETPPDKGFGKATLRLAPRYRMTPQTSDGLPVTGATVRIPVQWRLH